MFKKVMLAMLSSASVHAMTVGPNGGQTEMLAIGKPAFIKIQGKGSAPTGSLKVDGTEVSGNLEFDLQTLKTGIDLRDEHMKNNYLQVQQFPKAQLQIQKLTLNKAWTPKEPSVSETDFSGQLTLRGVTKPVSGRFSVSEKGEVKAEFKIKLTEFSVEIPTYMGITVADEVKLNINISELKESVVQANAK